MIPEDAKTEVETLTDEQKTALAQYTDSGRYHQLESELTTLRVKLAECIQDNVARQVQVGELLQESERITARADKLAAALAGLKRGSCWCEAGIDNPMMAGRHTAECVAAQEATDGKAPTRTVDIETLRDVHRLPPYVSDADLRAEAESHGYKVGEHNPPQLKTIPDALLLDVQRAGYAAGLNNTLARPTRKEIAARYGYTVEG